MQPGQTAPPHVHRHRSSTETQWTPNMCDRKLSGPDMGREVEGQRISNPRIAADSREAPFTFPQPRPLLPCENGHQKQALHELLSQGEPSMFDSDPSQLETDPQALSAAPTDVLQNIIEHQGAVELVRRLSILLAQRDAHITALIRLAEENNISTEQINGTASRVKRAEQRRLSLAAAAEDVVPPQGLSYDSSTSYESQQRPCHRRTSRGNGSISGITKLFSGKPSLRQRQPSPTPSAESSQIPRRSTRAPSVDVRSIQSAQSVQSAESSTWKDTASNLFKPASRNRESENNREPVEMITRLDKNQLPPTLTQSATDPQEAAWNRFILHLMKIRQQDDGCNGNIGLIGASKFGHEGQEGRQRMQTLIRLVVEGVPIQMRHSIWMELSNVNALVQPQSFADFLAQGEALDSGAREVILKDVPRTLTSKYDFYADKGFTRLKEVLVAFVGRHRELGYTQGLNSIAGYLLLTIPVREDAFWMLCNLVENFFPKDYFSGKYAMEAPQFDNSLLRGYVKQLMPQLNNHLDSLDIPSTHTVPMRWFFTAFSNVLPESLLLRIWDVWLCLPNQKHFLFNVALMLILHNYDDIMACDSDSALYALLDNDLKYPTEPEKITKFVKDAFNLGRKLEGLDEKRTQGLKWRLKRVGSVEVLLDEPLGGDELPSSPR